jgi:hypothetical protein
VASPYDQLLGANLIWMWGVRQLASYVDKKLPRTTQARYLLAAVRGKVTGSVPGLFRRPVRLTDRYLSDPYLRRLLTEQETTRHMTH